MVTFLNDKEPRTTIKVQNMVDVTACVIPGDSVEFALRGTNLLIEDFEELTRQDFIHGTLFMLREIGWSVIATEESIAKEWWYRFMERYNYWDVGTSSEEDELITHVSFTYARYLLSTYRLDTQFCNREISIDLINGDIFIYGK